MEISTKTFFIFIFFFAFPIGTVFAIEYSPPVVIQNPHDEIDFHFGLVIETVGDKIIVGNPDSHLSGSTSGAVFVYSENLTILLTTIKNPNPNPNADFGISLAELDERRVVIGAPGIENLEQKSAQQDSFGSAMGAVYIFNVDSGEEILKIHPPQRISESRFGASVDVTNNKNILVGAPKASGSGQSGGMAYLFDTTGKLLLTITDPHPKQGSEFGSVVTAFGDDILVANPISTIIDNSQAGQVYLFDGKTGQLIRTFQDDDSSTSSNAFARFGHAISVYDNHIIIGAPQDSSRDSQSGSIFLFEGNSGELVYQIANPDSVPFGEFGSSLILVDNYMFVGAPKNLGSFDVIPEENPNIISEPDVNVDINPNSGRVYVFETNTGKLLKTLENPSPKSDEHFGMTLASSGNNVIVGTPFDSQGIGKTGSVVVFYAKDESPYTHDQVKATKASTIPSWVKNTSDWWSRGSISDAEFLDAIQYMITNGLIIVSHVEFNENAPKEIPDWIKIRSEWWSQNQISDAEFLDGIEFLLENGLLRK